MSHAALHGEFLLVLHTLCWFMRGAPLAHPCAGLYLYGEFLLHAQSWFIWGVSLTCPVLVYVWSFSYTPHAGFFLLGVSLTQSMLASLCREFPPYIFFFFFFNVKVNKNVHNWVMLLFKAEADIQYRIHKCFFFVACMFHSGIFLAPSAQLLFV